MLRSRILLWTGFIIFILPSCIDRDILNVSDSLEVHSWYSVPIGAFEYDINDYLESLATQIVPTPDSLFFEDVLYPNGAFAVSFSSQDTFSFNVVRDPSGKVRSVEFVIIVSNGYPTEVAAQVYFLTGNSQAPTDSLLAGGPVKIQPADIDRNGVVTDPSTAKYTVTMPQAFIQKLSSITGILVKGRVNLTRTDIRQVKFYHDYQVRLHLGSRIELQFNTGAL
jgi:hypothetical protein